MITKRDVGKSFALGNYWTSPDITSINRLPMLNAAHLHSSTLNGEWRFQLLKNPEA
ncbi:MAG: hypothetical protein RLZZ14_455, partial [Actinomycetota bacterium]